MANTMSLIQSYTVGSGGSASIDFTSIPSIYTDLMVRYSLRHNASATIRSVQFRINSNSSSIYSQKLLDSSGSGAGSSASSGPDAVVYWAGLANDTNSTANVFSICELYIPNYTSSNSKSICFVSAAENNATTGNNRLTTVTAATSSPVTSINIIGEANFLQYSTAYLYGIKNS